MAVDPDLQAAVAARIQYYRDIGIFDFYRRSDSSAITGLQARVEEGAVSYANGWASAVGSGAEACASQLPIDAMAANNDPADHAAALAAIRTDLGDCQRCPLGATRNKLVFGDGDPYARLLFVGEGPGADEDAQGLPFVGRGGQLLNNMINAMGLKREQVYIANIVKCRPPQNRVPEPVEAHTCSPFLFRQIDAVRPEVIVALGSTAATYLLGAKSSLSGLRGRLHVCRGSKLIVTYHPAYLLRDPNQKKAAWADLQLAMRELGLRPPRPSEAATGAGSEA